MNKLGKKKLTIIGVGHLGNALLKGLIDSGINRRNIILSNKSEENKNAVLNTDTVLIAVKPFVVKQVLSELRSIAKDKLIISVAAGVSTAQIQIYLDNVNQKIIRLMPNIAISCNKGIIGFYANKNVSRNEKNKIKKLLSSLGLIIEVTNEEEINKLTVISACAPGIVAYLIELFSANAKNLGIPLEQADQIALQTFSGTIDYLISTANTAKSLEKSVSTKGGITEVILKSLRNSEFDVIFTQSLNKGYSKIKDLERKIRSKK